MSGVVELSPYVLLGLGVGIAFFLLSLSKGGNWLEALIGGCFVGVIVVGLVIMGKDKIAGP